MSAQIRLHRGSYLDSRATEQSIVPDEEGVRAYLVQQQVASYKPTDRLSVKLYSSHPHHGWDRHYIVKLNDQPVAFMSCALQHKTNEDL